MRLKSLSQTCKFGDFLEGNDVAKFKLKALDDALTDRFITGIRNEKIKQLLFKDETYDFEKCSQQALQYEMIEKESKPNNAYAVNAVRSDSRSRSMSRGNGKDYKKNWRDRSQSLPIKVVKNSKSCTVTDAVALLMTKSLVQLIIVNVINVTKMVTYPLCVNHQ